MTTTVPPMSGPWIQQKNLYVPGVENVTRDARGNPIGAPGRQLRDEEAVAVHRLPRVRVRLRVGRERQERRHLVRARSGPAGGDRSASAIFSTYFGGPKTRLCTSLGALFGKFTVVPGLHPEHLRAGRPAASPSRRRPSRPCSAAALVDARSAFPFAQPAVCCEQRLRLDLRRASSGRPRRRA